MPAKNGILPHLGLRRIEILVVFFTLLLISAVHFSRGLVTIASIGIVGTALYQGIRERNFRLSTLPVLMLLLTLLWLLDGLRAVDSRLWSDNFFIKFGFVLTGLSFYHFRTISADAKRFIYYGLALSFLITSTVSVIHYFQFQEEINQMLLQSKHVPLFSKMHHIHFGLFLAAAVFVCVYMAVGKNSVKPDRWIFGFTGLILLFNMHVLTSRTGLTGFYVAGITVIGMALIYSRDRKLKFGLLAGLILLPVVFTLSLPSLRSKMLNTGEDITATVEGGDDINHKSFGMRVEFWKTSLYLIKRHWMVGIGIGNQQYYLNEAYDARNSLLNKENRKPSSHNQILETFMTNGIPGVVSLILILGYSAIAAFRSRSWLYTAIFVITAWGLQFESLLERQHGALFFAFFIFLFWPSEENDGF